MAAINCVLGALIYCWLVWSCSAKPYAEPYSCYGDVCNEGSNAQFCDEVFRHCRLCDEVRDDCFSRLQTSNCSQFCSEYKLRKDLEKLRVGGCQVPSPPEHGRYDVNGTTVPLGATLAVICEAEYSVRNEHPMRCSNFSTWTESIPTCEGSQTDWKNYALFAFVGVFGISFVINIICVVQRHRSKCACKRKQECSRADVELQLLVDRNKIESQADTNHHTDTKITQPSAPALPIETRTDVESGLNSGNCRHDTNKAITDPDKGHLIYTHISSEEETSEMKNRSNASGLKKPPEETGKNPKDQENATHPAPRNSLDNQNCKTNFSVNFYLNTATPGTTNQSMKEPDGVVKQPDNLPHAVADETESRYIIKSMGGCVPDASTKGPVTNPVDEGFDSWRN